ncbi:hypothetical protein ACPUEN_00535 [Algoriphagus yeomjeoni]|uniref:hypothetical protein n=1 Tax=Algoriphagus yeomjeoni TaxID=291403 RepID=UPI003CE4BCBB
MKPVWETLNPKLFKPYDEVWSVEDHQRYQLILDYPVGKIIKLLHSSYNRLFNSEGLFNPYLGKDKIENIKDRWTVDLPIDPPLLFWDYSTKSTMIENGIHRIDYAIELRTTHLPILIPRIDYAIFCLME